jgi:autotransporter-associated beta strand protein
MNRTLGIMMAACAAALLVVGSALATDGTWSIASGGGNYNATNSWAGGVIAEGVGATLNISGAGTTLYLNTNVTVGAILYNATFQQKLNFMSPKDPIQWPQPFFLTLDTGAPDTSAQVWHQLDYLASGTPRQILDYPIMLNSDLLFRSSFTNKWEDNDGPAFSVHSDISEGVAGRSLIVSNDHPNMQMTLFGSNSFSGPVRVQQGVLRIADRYQASGIFSQLGAGTEVYVSGNTATLDLNGLSVGPNKTLRLGGAGGFGMGALANSYQVPFHTSVWHGAVSLVATATLGKGVGGGQFWPSAYGGPLEVAGDITDNGNGFGLIKTSSNPVYLRGNNTYGGGTTISEGYLVATNAANLGTGPVIFNDGTFGFGGSFDLSARTLTNINSKIVKLDTAGYDVTLAGNLSTFANGLTKNGAGTLTLSGANSYKGVSTVNQGTLKLDYSSQLNSKVATASGLALAGGTLAISGGSGYTQAVSHLTLSAGASSVTNLNPFGGTVMNFSSTLSRSAGATVSFGTAGAPMTLSPGVNNGLYGGFATYGDSTWATKNATDYNFQFITGYTGYSEGWGVVSNVDVTVANVGAVGDSAQANTLRFNNSDSAGTPVTLTLSGTNSLTGGGILVTPAMGANPATIQGGTLTSKNANWNDLIIFQNNTSAPLVITSSITNNGATAISLTKSGPGALVVSNSASLFKGSVYVNGGALEIFSGSDLGDTNTAKNVYLNEGATLRMFGTFDLGSTGAVCTVVASVGDTVIDIPNEGDTVTVTGPISIYGRLFKKGRGTLRLAKTTTGVQVQADTFFTMVVEAGALELATSSVEFFGRPGVLVVRNGAKLKGYKFFSPRSFGRADYQDRFVLRVEGAGAVMDLNGVSASAGYGTIPLGEPAILPNDYFEGDGRLVLTNSSATTARFTPTRGTHARFTGVFEVPGDYLTSGSTAVFALPNGELRLGKTAVARFDGITDFCKFGALTGSGYFGGWGDQSRPPFYVGDDRSETFEFSGLLVAYFSGAGWGDTPATGCRFIKTGSSAWRISGTTNDIRQAFTVRKGAVLTGADSTGVNLGALGKGPVWLGDSETLANESLALLTDGPYVIGNRVEIKTTAPGVTITLGGTQTAGASSFTNALALTRDVTLTSANTDGNGVTFSGKITGPGGITKTGVGTVYLTGVVSNAGPTVVQAGQLVVQGNVTLTNTLTVTAGAVGAGTFAVNGNLTLGAGAQLAVSAGTLDRNQTYTLAAWTGTRSGTFAPVTGLPADWHVGERSNSYVLYYAPPGTLLRVL